MATQPTPTTTPARAVIDRAAAGLTRRVVAASRRSAPANRPAGVAVQPGPPTARACAAIDQAAAGPTQCLDSSVAHPRAIARIIAVIAGAGSGLSAAAG